MKFSVNSSELLKRLSVALSAVASNPMMPILEDFKLELKNSFLNISASNLATTIETKIQVVQEEEGCVAVPAKIFTETIRGLNNQIIDFLYIKDENNIYIKSQSIQGEYNMAGNDADDFPTFPSYENVTTFSLSADKLASVITKTIFATSNDDLRLAMTGVCMRLESNTVTFVATDAQKMVKYSISGVNIDQEGTIILPKKTLNTVKNILDDSGEISISYNDNFVFFISGDTVITGKLVEGVYPDFNAVIPVNSPNKMIIDRLEFLNSVKRISIFANKTTNQIALNISEQNLEISTKDLDFSNQADEVIHFTSYEGTPITIAFSGKFLIEILSALEGNEVVMELSGPMRPALIIPVESDPDENIVMLIMPVLLHSY